MALFRKKTESGMKLRQMAARIKDEAELGYIVSQARPQFQAGILGALKPHLKFKFNDDSNNDNSRTA